MTGPQQAEQLIRHGGTVAEALRDFPPVVKRVLSCLPTDEAVPEDYRGPDGAFANAQRGSLVIDMSTVYPDTSHQLARLVRARSDVRRDHIGEYSGCSAGGLDPVWRRDWMLRRRRVDLSRDRQRSIFMWGRTAPERR